MKKKKKYNYKAVSLPQELLELVDKIIEHDVYYRNRAQFVKSAIMSKITELKEAPTLLVKVKLEDGKDW